MEKPGWKQCNVDVTVLLALDDCELPKHVNMLFDLTLAAKQGPIQIL